MKTEQEELMNLVDTMEKQNDWEKKKKLPVNHNPEPPKEGKLLDMFGERPKKEDGR